jgi:hypothetical protein
MLRTLLATITALLSLTAHAQDPYLAQLEESKIRAVLKNDSTVVSIPISNSADHPIKARLGLVWMSIHDTGTKPDGQDVMLPPGQSQIEIPLPLSNPSVWTRLCYSLIPDRAQARSFAPVSGIVSLPHIADYVFEINLSYAGLPRGGNQISVFSEAVHPVTRSPITAVQWNAKLSIKNKELAPVRIDIHEEGFAEVIFNLPTGNYEDLEHAEVQISGRRGDFEQKASIEMPISSRLSARIQSDKPIYQPGQIMHLRAVILDARGKALSNAKIKLRIEAPDHEAVHTIHMVSSKFGIVQDEWTIPDTGILGEHHITLSAESTDAYQIARHTVRISRYELPAFRVTATPDRKVYLPTEQPRVAINGTYLFGKPVPKGQVKIVRTVINSWNPATHKLESPEETVAEGNTREDGTFIAQLDLTSDHEYLQNLYNERFQDIPFIAYYRDLDSGRTEQRRFDIRITKEPIHIYLILARSGGPLPTAAYISTFYADGQPASAALEFIFNGQTTRLHTNRYGIGKTFLLNKYENIAQEIEIKATDASGKTGSCKEKWWPGRSLFQLETSHTIHRVGEAVTLKITAPPDSVPDQLLMIHALSENRRVVSRMAQLKNHKGEVTFPYQKEFRREICFVAWNAVEPKNNFTNRTFGSKTVIFPDGSDLKIVAVTERSTYKPGEKATLRMQVAVSDGKPVEAALGVAVVDQAVLERTRTDSEFGNRHWFSCAFCKDDGEREIGGIRLNDILMIKPEMAISQDLDLAAEALVAKDDAYFSDENSESLKENPEFDAIFFEMARLRVALDRYYINTLELPQSLKTLSEIFGRQWTQLSDPWGMPYSTDFGIREQNYTITLRSSGPDKRWGTTDDFIVNTFQQSYFTPIRFLMAAALKKQNYPAAESEFSKILSDNGLLFSSLHDPWGTAYQVEIQTIGATRSIEIRSAGPDCKFETQDDFVETTFKGLYFQQEELRIKAALQKATIRPQTVEEFLKLLENEDIDISSYRDAWDRPYLVRSALSSHYDDRASHKITKTFGGPATLQKEVVPVTQNWITFYIHSMGPDGIENTFDDFDITVFQILLNEESVQSKTVSSSQPLNTLNGTGSINGAITDPSTALIPGAAITLINEAGAKYVSYTDSTGHYQFMSVPPGNYLLRAEMAGFTTVEVSRVLVDDNKTTHVDIELPIGSISEAVMVASPSSAEALEQSASTGSITTIPSSATPRVRDYFPETLLWIPETITDASGSARALIPSADSVTTWKIAVVASTMDGQIAEAESDFRTFQPFFLDFNPPQVLTEGDQVDLPVTIRNYRDQAQKVNISLEQNEWSSIQGSSMRQTTVPAGQSVHLAYSIQAKRVTGKAVQRIIARGGRDRDAIEKSLRIHPDGQEISHTYGDLVTGPTSFTLKIPPTAIAGATRGELRLYPNAASLLLESSSAILAVPRGCAEQTISAGYASLIAWRFAHSAGIKDDQIKKRTLANVRLALDSLGRFRNYDGGIRYWSTGEPDIAVTAYALRFLLEASVIVPVDDEELKSLISWLEKHQTDGIWQPRNNHVAPSSPQALLLTGTVVRSLAKAHKTGMPLKTETLAGAYHHLAKFTDTLDEPYMLANFVLAALASGDEALLGNAVTRLASLAHEERGGLYWDLQTNTPFYGWGIAGRYETTALAVSALAAWRAAHPESRELDATIRRGLVFLLRGRDQAGIWLSTQSTVQVMHAMFDASLALGSLGSQGGTIEVYSNGRPAKTIQVPDDPKSMDPIMVDLYSFLSSGDNQITIQPSGGMQTALVLLSSTYWLPWEQTKVRTFPELHLDVRLDRLEMRAGDWVQCSVKAKRLGFRGYGMMLAEIGLPPAADVDRASLESAMEDRTTGIEHYEILPDRVVFYLWPEAGGSSFSFQLSARMPMNAKSEPSVLYDYYNPEARSELLPFRWIVTK